MENQTTSHRQRREEIQAMREDATLLLHQAHQQQARRDQVSLALSDLAEADHWANAAESLHPATIMFVDQLIDLARRRLKTVRERLDAGA